MAAWTGIVRCAGVQTFNSAGLTFRAELFIVTAIIAWTYLLHAWFRREGIDYRYAGQKTKEGAEKFWELGQCLKQPKCPMKGGVARNLEFLIEIRHEIEHRSTNRIDDALGAKLQSCALNFNGLLKKEFGAQLDWRNACRSRCSSFPSVPNSGPL